MESQSVFSGISHWIKKVSYWPLLFLRGIFFVFDHILFLIIIASVGFYGFVLNDQGQDMMLAFGTMSFPNEYIGIFTFMIATWATIMWFVSRVILNSANLLAITYYADQNIIDETYRSWLEWLALNIPRLMAIIPYAIFLYAYLNVNGLDNNGIFPVLMFVLMVVHVYLLVVRTKLVLYFVKKPEAKEEVRKNIQSRFQLQEETDVMKILKTQKLLWIFWLLVALALAVFYYSYQMSTTIPSLEGKPGLVILSALIVYGMAGLVISYISNRSKFPIFTLLLLLMLFFSLKRNNNHRLDYVTKDGVLLKTPARESDKVFFENWLKKRLEDSACFINTPNGKMLPVIIVASEGGGIRACYWTVNVLKNFYATFPSLYRNTFAATGASGGSVGLGFFYNYRYALAKNNKLFDSAAMRNVSQIAGADLLSAVTYGFTFPDMAQRLLPFRIYSFDRAKFLGNSFSRSFTAYSGLGDKADVLSEAYIDPWSGADKYDYPVLLFNSLFVEQGQKAVFSPYQLSRDHYHDVLDVLGEGKLMVRMREGMISSSRFPIITPPGQMYATKSDSILGHLVDGGYFENTAIQTAQETMSMMNDVINSMKSQPSYASTFSSVKVKPMILSVLYGNGGYGNSKPLGAGYEAAPVVGAMNTLFRWIEGARELVIKIDTSGNMKPTCFRLPVPLKDSVYTVHIDGQSKNVRTRIPLGWYLSPTARQIMDEEVIKVKDPVFREIQRRIEQ